MSKCAIIFSFGVEYIRFQRELNMSGSDVGELLEELIINMMYWQSHWSPCKTSEEIMVNDWNIEYFEYNNLKNDIYRIHSTLEKAFDRVDDMQWGMFDVNVIIRNEEYFDMSVRNLGDYRIEQWYIHNGSKLCPNGALRESVSGNRWRDAHYRPSKKRTPSRR